MSNNKFLRDHSRNEPRLVEQSLGDLVQNLDQNNQQEPSNAIRYLTSRYDLTKDEVKRVIGLIGVKKAIEYTDYFFNSTLERNLYLLGAVSISRGSIDPQELVREKNSPFELNLKYSLSTFSIPESKLNQEEYRRVNRVTGLNERADRVKSCGHLVEHEYSRLDRLSENRV